MGGPKINWRGRLTGLRDMIYEQDGVYRYYPEGSASQFNTEREALFMIYPYPLPAAYLIYKGVIE